MLLPTTVFDFIKNPFDPRITFSRASTGTYFDSSGVLQTAANDSARIDYDPATLSKIGFLLEQERTNICLQSENFGTTWTNQQSSETLNAGVAPDGNTTADKLIPTAVNDGHWISQSMTVVSGSYTFSFFAKADGYSIVQVLNGNSATDRVNFDLSNGTVGSATSYTGRIVPIKDGWYRCIATFTASAGTGAWARIGIVPSSTSARGAAFTGDGTSGVLLWGAQMELGATATSYIATTTASATRNADIATVTGTNFSSWWNATEGCILARYRTSTVSGTRPVIQFDDTTADEIICLRGNTTNPELYIKDSTDQVQIDAGTIAANTDYRFVAGWKLNECAASINGGNSVLDGAATIPTVTQTRLGSDGTNYLNGHIQTIEYYNRKLTNETLQQLASSAGRFSVLSPILRQVVQS